MGISSRGLAFLEKAKKYSVEILEMGRTLRSTKFIRPCAGCQKKEIVSYSQVWNYVSETCSPTCKSCTGKQTLNNPGHFKKNHRSWNTGIKGEKSHTFKHGKTKDAHLNWKEYKELKKAALKRAGYKCSFCDSNKKLELDHIKPRYFYPELQFSLENCRILCHSCHVRTDTYGAKVKKLSRNMWE